MPNPADLSTADSINEPRFSVPIDSLVKNLPELHVNPFAKRLCEVFSHDNDVMMFEEFLDMMSVLSENAPREVREILFDYF